MSDPKRPPRAGWKRTAPVWALLGMAALLGSLAPSCLERRDDENATGDAQRCASCHGDPTRDGDFLARSAPPNDLAGDTNTAFPGVGAHQFHMQGSSTHGPVPCGECHAVPEATESPGHADDARPAELQFGSIARTGGRSPSYDFGARRCSDSWCHRDADAVWTKPRSSEDACGSCHALPPAAPHPESKECSRCHGEVIAADGKFVAPERHVNGIVDVEFTGCSDCHGSDDNSAPPKDTQGNTQVSAIGVGAHQVHLSGGVSSRALECAECHTVPTEVGSPGHADDLPAEVVLLGVATTGGRAPTWDRAAKTCAESWCHSPSPVTTQPSPDWTVAATLSCTGCHGAPPPAPHPQRADCAQCHGDVVAADNVSIKDPTRHVDGVVDVLANLACNACHGSTNPAPPLDVAGNSATTFAGVGAHQTHLAGSAISRPVPCEECHKVPTDYKDTDHLGALPAELVFSGAAVAKGSTPAYSNGTCSNTWCHASKGVTSGGTVPAPSWTKVDGSQAACGSCHALPPPIGHPQIANCNQCHKNIATDNLTFPNPATHVDGVVTF